MNEALSSRTVHLLSHLILPTVQPGLLLTLLIRKLRLNAQSWEGPCPWPWTLLHHPLPQLYGELQDHCGKRSNSNPCSLLIDSPQVAFWLGFVLPLGGIHVFKDQKSRVFLPICSHQAGAHPVSSSLLLQQNWHIKVEEEGIEHCREQKNVKE